MNQILHAVRQMAHDGGLKFPAWEPEPLALATDAPNREVRLQFHGLPFRFLQPGNSNATQGRRHLKVDSSFCWQTLEAGKFFKRCERIKSPEDSSVLLVYLCPKGGDVIGPLIKGSPYQHHCFANRVIAHLIQGYKDPPDIPDRFTTVPCNSACPPEDSVNPHEPQTRTPAPSPAIYTQSVPSTPATSTSASSTPSFASSTSNVSASVPCYHNRDRSASPHASADNTSVLFHCESQSHPAVEERLIDLRPLVQITRPHNVTERPRSPLCPYSQPSTSHNSITPPPNQSQPAAASLSDIVLDVSRPRRGSHRHAPRVSYDDTGSPIIPFDTASFISIDQLCQSIDASADVGHSTSILHIEAESIIHAANGLVGWLKHQRLHMDDPHSYKPPNDASSFVISPDAPEDRLNIFSKIWQVQAGHPDATDSIGDGVLRHVLESALAKCISWKPSHTSTNSSDGEEGDTCETLDDGYVTLKISSFPSDEKLDIVFALGRLAAIYMIKVSNGPDPVSPALLECVINGLDAIMDLPWLRHFHPSLMQTLILLPVEHGGEMPSNVQDCLRLVRIFQTHMGSTYGEIVQASNDQWPQIKRDFFSSALLGHPAAKIINSSEFRAFKDGFDMFLTTSLGSLCHSLSPVSKKIFQDIFNRRVTVDALIPLLRFEIDGDAVFRAHMSPMLESFQDAFYRYLRGSGHPNDPLFSAFTVQEGAAADPNYRARRFVKVLSGIHLLPPTTLRLFKINLVQHIPDSVTFNGQYNINEDVIPPLPHTCLYTLDVFINPPLIKYLQNPSNDPQELTAFDRCLHYAFLEAGDDSFNARMPITV
ncbi:hypothetical protein BD769DRAFT_1775932 [Suillus cothurnatus]|nr:hypothetical protein BD769DRAFT_1775932 [Suillus cothurnatus]